MPDGHRSRSVPTTSHIDKRTQDLVACAGLLISMDFCINKKRNLVPFPSGRVVRPGANTQPSWAVSARGDDDKQEGVAASACADAVMPVSWSRAPLARTVLEYSARDQKRICFGPVRQLITGWAGSQPASQPAQSPPSGPYKIHQATATWAITAPAQPELAIRFGGVCLSSLGLAH